MFLRPHQRRRNGRLESYWALVETYRTERGPRQRTLARLGLTDQDRGRLPEAFDLACEKEGDHERHETDESRPVKQFLSQNSTRNWRQPGRSRAFMPLRRSFPVLLCFRDVRVFRGPPLRRRPASCLTDAEAAFRIQKSDLSLRPAWHQKEKRVDARILACFLAFVLWKFLGQLPTSRPGDEQRRELSELRSVDVILPTKEGFKLRTRWVTQPSDHQKILLRRLGLELPTRLNLTPM